MEIEVFIQITLIRITQSVFLSHLSHFAAIMTIGVRVCVYVWMYVEASLMSIIIIIIIHHRLSTKNESRACIQDISRH